MGPARRRREGGATRLEWAVATILAALLAGVLLNRLTVTADDTERVAAKQLIGSLRTALSVRSAKVISTTGEPGLLALAHQNPMTWLQHPPENYLGEYYSPNKLDLPAGHWYFDRAEDTLVFLPAGRKTFSSETQKILAFKVKLLRVSSPVAAGGRSEGTSGLVLDQLDDQPLATTNLAGSVPRPYFSEKK